MRHAWLGLAMLAVLVGASFDVSGDADVEDVRAAGHDVDVVGAVLAHCGILAESKGKVKIKKQSQKPPQVPRLRASRSARNDIKNKQEQKRKHRHL